MKKSQWIRLLPLLSLLFLIPVAYASFSGIYSADLYWHLKSGEDFLFFGLNPFVDHYSLDFNGASVKNFTPIFDGLGALFYNWLGGDQGLQWFRLLLLSIPVILLFHIGRRRQIGAIELFWAMSLMVACITFRKLIRPELCSYGLILIFVLALFSKEKKIRTLVGLAIIQWLWQYFHSTAVFGYVILSGVYCNYLLDAFLVHQRDYKRIAILFALGCATLAVGFINPNGSHLLLAYFESDHRWHKWIVELVPKSLNQREWFFQYLWILSIFVPVMALWKRNWGAAWVMSIFLFYCYRVAKVMPHQAILSASVGMLLIQELKPLFRIKFQWGLNIILISLTAVQTGYIIGNIFGKEFNPKPIPHLSRFPVDIIDNIKKRDLRGSVINSYMMGGYLMYHLAPKLKIYIDGRTNILFPFDFFNNYVKAARDVDEFNSLDDRKKFDYVIGYLTHNNRVVDSALESGRFGISEVGSQSALLSRIEKSDFPITSFYFRFPQCIDERGLERMAPEISKVAQTQIPQSQLRYFFKTLVTYYQSKDRKKFINDFVKAPYAYNVSNRFMAYQALRAGMPDHAIDFFTRSKEKYKSRDLLALVDTLLQRGKFSHAYHFFVLNVDIIMPNWKRKILRKQYEILKEKLGEEVATPEVAAQIEERLALDQTPPGSGGAPNPCL